MSALLYVTTSTKGTEHTAAGEVQWNLPPASEPGKPAASTEGNPLVLRPIAALLEVLDSTIYVAEPLETGEEQANGELFVTTARLLRKTPWAPTSAALFALDCATHVLGEAGEVELPVGFTLASALDDARSYLVEASDDVGERLGRLARFSAARRLRKTGAKIGDIAIAMLEEDLTQELDSSADATWATTTAAGDAVLAAVEALRHVAAPGYISAREATAEREESPIPVITPMPLQTPWGPIMLGAEHESPYLSAGALAREAAFRAREAVGEELEEAERRYQSARLAEVLEAS